MITTEIKRVKNHINGEWVESTGTEVEAVPNPATGKIIAYVPLSPKEDVEKAVEAAKAAFETWSKVPVPNRSRNLYKYLQLLQEHKDELAKIITLENGKTLTDATGEVQRGIEAVELATSAPNLMMGQALPNIASGIDGSIWRYPIGVVAGITPFNFPMMIPLWMFPLAIACGNTFVLKTSERTPLLAERLVELFYEAGFPKGVLNLVQGGKDVVNSILENKDIQAVSFVGSEPVARYVYETGTKHGKRVQALAGAKNHAIVMPDCNLEKTVQGVIGSAFASSGERCMACSVVAVVDEIADEFIDVLVAETKKLKVGDGFNEDNYVGPLIRESHKERVLGYINSGVADGATLLVDGRKINEEVGEGYFVGATIFDGVNQEMKIWQDEIFAPVLSIVRVKDLEEGIKLTNQSKFANGAVIYTSNGKHAQTFRDNIDAGMIGVNVNVPAPMAFFAFAGNKASFFGDLGTNGTDGVQFYTRKKVVTERWF
ncbi:CoA-acylating methylmalonate-semialdehyde dehydrogenase [Bacillus sp. S70]|uniref:CoA-acylating methylmalonate-semialdehyde dehydrogenase n=1 Tax=unclassified Bacillus (in: firmicutes) TaxID=185979 RepID=UPI00190C4CF6|nr:MULTISPECIES: CoA-acylating methylmalonate-semialdehyde dehydrogenase [unclassified Bacillus (in: firmicutes)]MBJ9982328.1 CoA-acylating methylmalonate-semialdehyde dehydrogenase [Bacillus sp. S29]MBK0103557.1 CoA-acylating methylmalonate-semialdehyde dehydrogenase [Bacillus sp. S70]MBK0109099.1 CoA-acylating methylmalonate-semialdehyde dehydrogenase [Bacillus sp. S73]MBK0138039.1 CoA-acylating methylmalonate-semialdehyde dehydrogenase [Bacillus sp. S72]MBK0150304.1 CoA-acylating methylmalo